MIALLDARAAAVALLLALFGATGFAQDKPAGEYEPQVGQSGKDVVWVPTPQSLVNRMLDMGKLTSRDYHIDLGSGDGRTVITAAKRGATSLGIEYNPDMVTLSQRNAAKEGVSARAQFRRADLFETDLSKATLITLFLLPDINLKLRPKLLDLRPGTRIVSNSFTMGEWQHDASTEATDKEGCTAYCTAYLWIVPAKAGGTWKLGSGELVLKQEFQMLTGTLTVGGRQAAVTGRLNGASISFKAGNVQYTGRVDGDAMKGTTKSGSAAGEWTATRASRD